MWKKNQNINHSIFEVCKLMGGSLELKELLNIIIDHTTTELGAQRGSILLIDSDSDQLKMLASKGMPKDVVEKGYIPRKNSISEWVLEHKEPLILNDKVKDDRFQSAVRSPGMFTSMCVPLQVKGDVIGTLNISKVDDPNYYKESDLEIMVILASQAAISIQNARLYEENIRAARLATVGQTVAGISHDIKNILTPIKGGMAIIELAQSKNDWGIIDKGIKMLRRNIDDLSCLVLDMLDYSKEREPFREKTDIDNLIDNVYQSSKFRVENKSPKINVKKIILGDIDDIPIDKSQISRCLMNLAVNAIDAMHNGGELIFRGLRLFPNDDEFKNYEIQGYDDIVVIEVSDTGEGIPQENIREIYMPFFSTKGSKGTGIGLAVTKKIIEEHKGKIVVESEVGKGTKFSLILPVIQSEK